MSLVKVCIFILSVITISCASKTPMELDYCKMLEDDQSHLNNDTTNLEKYDQDKTARKEKFTENFNQILQLTKQEGFPKVSFYDQPLDSCKYWAITATFIHIAQTQPELLFNKKTADLFKSEMEKGNLDKELFIPACRISSRTMHFCESIKPDLEYSMNLWDLIPNPFEEAKFTKCE